MILFSDQLDSCAQQIKLELWINDTLLSSRGSAVVTAVVVIVVVVVM